MTVKTSKSDLRAPAQMRGAVVVGGPEGATGSVGPAPTLTIGSVATLASGLSATATVVPTGLGAYTLNLGLPRGDQGISGSVAGTITTAQITDAGTKGTALVQANTRADALAALSLVVGDVANAVSTAALGAAGGIATLDAGAKLPASQLSTALVGVNGLLKGNGAGGFTAAAAGTDYLAPLVGDIITSGNTATIASAAVSYAKIQNVSATSRILGRKSSGSGTIEELAASDISNILGLANVATSGNAADLATGTLPAARLPAFGSGDVSFASGGGAGSIGAGRVTNTMLAGSIAANKLVGWDIATVGTITAGVWNGAPINLSTYASGTLQAAQFPALTGDVTSSAGSVATSIGAGRVTNTMLAGSIAASKLVGTDIAIVGTLTTGATGAGFTVNLGTSTLSGTLPAANTAALTGDITKSAGSNATTIANGAVTNAKMAVGAAVANLGYTPANKTGDILGNMNIGVNSQTIPAPSANLYVSWNYSGGNGEVNLWNTFPGGFTFSKVNSAGSSTDLMTLSPSGGLTAAGFSGSGSGLTGITAAQIGAGTFPGALTFAVTPTAPAYGFYTPGNALDGKRAAANVDSAGNFVFFTTNDANTSVQAEFYLTRSNELHAGKFVGDGSGLTGVTSNTFAGLTDKGSYFPGASTNVQSTGVPGLDMTNSSGFQIFNNVTTTGVGANPTLNVQRSASYSGAAVPVGWTCPVLHIYDVIGSGVPDFMWSTNIETNNYSTSTTAQNVCLAATHRAYNTGSTHASKSWASNIVMEDHSGGNPTNARIGMELDMMANGPDDGIQRIGIDLIGGLVSGGTGVGTTIGAGIRLTTQDGTGSKFHSGIVLGGNMDYPLDLRSLTPNLGNSPIIFNMTTSVRHCANDADAAANGVPVGGIYRTNSGMMVRVS